MSTLRSFAPLQRDRIAIIVEIRPAMDRIHGKRRHSANDRAAISDVRKFARCSSVDSVVPTSKLQDLSAKDDAVEQAEGFNVEAVAMCVSGGGQCSIAGSCQGLLLEMQYLHWT
mmetsp:Transcript_137788/g.274764  ORF Transcript_137788/g.274764 Transcript_137788/m.274764 type:complete len:114 (-) Transcript_137788:99-440(-)